MSDYVKFTATKDGLVPASGGGFNKFLRCDGYWVEVSAGGGGGITDGDKGDITVSGSGATWTIDNTAVTFGKIQDISTARLLGRTSAGAGSIEQLTNTQVKTFLAITNTDVSGLGTLATQSGTFSGTSSGTNTGDQNIFSTIAVSGQSNVVADTTSDTLTLVAGTNVTITTNAATDTITINSTTPSDTVNHGLLRIMSLNLMRF